MNLDWKKVDGLIPTIIQDQKNLQILMMGYMNQEALNISISSGYVTFFSRTKQALWTKGEKSGNKLKISKIVPDCDQDTLLILASNFGPTCHLGNDSCFKDSPKMNDFIEVLESTIESRFNSKDASSYTYLLKKKGLKEIAKKITEEAGELSISAVTKDGRITDEAADLVFHLLVLLKHENLTFKSVIKELEKRSR
jgi:phosphoribosyl-ATP pyrophosphohydrolase/phosphoribosyl-AMP cyclohydrolase